MAVTFDTLKAARRLQDEAGFDEKQAAVLVSTFAEIVTERLATKTESAQGLTVLRGEMGMVRTEVGALRGAGRALLSRGGTTYLYTRPTHVAIENMGSELIADMRASEQRFYMFMGVMLSAVTFYLTAVISIATAIILANL